MTNAERIEEIRALLQTGAVSVSPDGNTTFDPDSLRKELRRLESEDGTAAQRRPVASSIYLGGF